MRWDAIAKIIEEPYSVLTEIYPTRIKYFLIQNNTDYTITAKQFERIWRTNTLNTTYKVRTDRGIEERTYYSKKH
jgi:hypothetical protein